MGYLKNYQIFQAFFLSKILNKSLLVQINSIFDFSI
jgi:hypothetical protein